MIKGISGETKILDAETLCDAEGAGEGLLHTLRFIIGATIGAVWMDLRGFDQPEQLEHVSSAVFVSRRTAFRVEPEDGILQ